MDIKEILAMDNPAEAAQAFAEKVNNFGFYPRLEVEALNPAMVDRLAEISNEWAHYLCGLAGQNYIDGRIEASVRTACKLSEMGVLNKEKKTPYLWRFVETMSRQHKTLQQSFSGLCFAAMAKKDPTIAERFGYVDWYRMPLV